MFSRLREMLIKEFLQMLRDPRMRVILFIAPTIQMLIIAFALITEVHNAELAVLDFDESNTSREIIQAFSSSGYFELEAYARNDRELRRLLDSGKARVALSFPADFEQNVLAGKEPSLQVIIDGTQSNSAQVIAGYANQITQQFHNQNDSRRPFGIQIQERAWFNANLESRYYFVPGLVAVMVMVVSLLLTSLGIVREKEIGTIEQIMVSPIRKIEFIVGKTLPYMVTGYITMGLMLILARIVFKVPMQGSWVLYALMAGLYIICNLGVALMISVSARTQQQALLTAFLFLMPAVMLSGFIFPIRNMPEPVQILTYLNPMRWFLEITHGIVLRGVGLEVLWPAALAMAALAAVSVTSAVALFRKRLS